MFKFLWVSPLLIILLMVEAYNPIDVDKTPFLLNEAFTNLQILKAVTKSTNATLESMQNVYENLKIATDAIIDNNEKEINTRLAELSISPRKIRNITTRSIVSDCIAEENPQAILSQIIKNETKKCITVALAENTNIITNTIKEAQAFMSLPQIITEDLERCGLEKSCLQEIAIHAIQESINIPSTVLVFAARIQQIAYHSLAAIDGCALDALLKISKIGAAIIEDISGCIEDAV